APLRPARPQQPRAAEPRRARTVRPDAPVRPRRRAGAGAARHRGAPRALTRGSAADPAEGAGQAHAALPRRLRTSQAGRRAGRMNDGRSRATGPGAGPAGGAPETTWVIIDDTEE